MGLPTVVQRRAATGVLITLTFLTVSLGGASSSPSSNCVVVVVVAVGLRVVVAPGPSSSPLLTISLLPPRSIFIVGIVLNNKIIISRKLGVRTESHNPNSA